MKVNNFASKAFIRWYITARDWREFRYKQREQRQQERNKFKAWRKAQSIEVFMHRREAMKALGIGAFLAATTATSAYAADLVFTSYSFPGAGSPTSRTMPARIGDIFNVKEYGAIGNAVANDTAAIQAAFTAMWASTYGAGTLFFPPGNYIVTGIDISKPAGNFTDGRIVGASRWSTYINGNLPNGFIFSQPDSVNGPEEIGHLSLVNSSTWIGSGALMYNNGSVVVHDCHLQGMICALLPSNIYIVNFNNCYIESNVDVTTGHHGTLGIAGGSCSIKGLRSTSPFLTCIQVYGSSNATISDIGIENGSVGILLGVTTGWAGNCKVSGTTLTVDGPLGSLLPPQFVAGDQLFGRGLNLQAWGADPNDASGTFIVSQLSGTPGFAGTYQLNQSYTISTPVPMWTRHRNSISAITVNSVGTEAYYHSLYVSNASCGTFISIGAGATPIECVDVFGVTGYTSRCGIYLQAAGACKFISCTPQTNAYLGSFVIDPSANITNVTFDSCVGSKLTDNTITATISNGSGGAGTILNVSAWAGGGIGIGMVITDAGVPVATVVGNHASDPTLTGVISTGTYRSSASLNLSSRTLKVITGTDWLMPTVASSKAGLKFINCGSANLPAGIVCGLNTLNMTFTCLPGEAGASSNMPVIEGMEYNIVDGAKSGGGAAAFGDATQGGGTQHIKVWYNGTSWIRNG